MNRTGELTLGIIGTVFCALQALIGMLFLSASNSELLNGVKQQISNDPSINLSSEEITAIFAGLSSFGAAVLISALVGVILGIIAVIFIRGNKKPKLAGALFIIGAILTAVISIGFGFLPAILYLIAGIMCFVRKAPLET